MTSGLIGELLCFFGIHWWEIKWRNAFMFRRHWHYETIEYLECKRCGAIKRLGL